MQKNKMCSFIQTTVTQVIRITPSFCKNTCQLKTIKITTKTQLNDQLGSKKITTTFHSGDFCKPSSCYQQTEVIELLAEAITSAYF